MLTIEDILTALRDKIAFAKRMIEGNRGYGDSIEIIARWDAYIAERKQEISELSTLELAKAARQTLH